MVALSLTLRLSKRWRCLGLIRSILVVQPFGHPVAIRTLGVFSVRSDDRHKRKGLI